MACYHPLQAFLPPSGGRPIFSYRPRYTPTMLPCGQCVGCRIDRSRQWATRIMHESQMHSDNAFLTLTYSDDFLPSPPSLSKRDLQLFFKRYRKFLTGVPIRYYSCGEYGSTTARPHYHCCIFGHDFPDKVPFKTNAQGDWLYTSETLNKLWGLGHCLIGDLTFQSAAYVARYVMKKVTGKGSAAHYHAVDEDTGESVKFEQEFTVMSRKPGIGRPWLDRYGGDVYPHDFVISKAGAKLSVPKYYDSVLAQSDPGLLERLKALRKESALSRSDDSTPRRLRDRESVKLAQLGLLKRGL